MEDSNVDHPIMADPADTAMIDTNIDDLFGESANGLPPDALSLAIPSAPLPSGLVLRIAEMQGRGCCT